MANYVPPNYQLRRVDYSLTTKCNQRGISASWTPKSGATALTFKGILGPIERSLNEGGFGEDAEAVGVFTTARSFFDDAQDFRPHGTMTIGTDTFRVMDPISVGKVYIKFALGDSKA